MVFQVEKEESSGGMAVISLFYDIKSRVDCNSI